MDSGERRAYQAQLLEQFENAQRILDMTYSELHRTIGLDIDVLTDIFGPEMLNSGNTRTMDILRTFTALEEELENSSRFVAIVKSDEEYVPRTRQMKRKSDFIYASSGVIIDKEQPHELSWLKGPDGAAHILLHGVGIEMGTEEARAWDKATYVEAEDVTIELASTDNLYRDHNLLHEHTVILGHQNMQGISEMLRHHVFTSGQPREARYEWERDPAVSMLFYNGHKLFHTAEEAEGGQLVYAGTTPGDEPLFSM